jgi:hypothetical protein
MKDGCDWANYNELLNEVKYFLSSTLKGLADLSDENK